MSFDHIIKSVVMAPAPGDPMPNPYNRLLCQALSNRMDIQPFRWGNALFRNTGIIHIHWPDGLIASKHRIGVLIKCFLLLLIIAKARLGSVKLVWTVHNDSPHEHPDFIARWTIRCWTKNANKIYLSNANLTKSISDRQQRLELLTTVIPIGEYPGYASNTPRNGALGEYFIAFGLLRPYKQFDKLITLFESGHLSELRLIIIGSRWDPSYTGQILSLAESVPNVSVIPDFIPESELLDFVRSARGCILPYADMNNSSALILSLGLGTPVLATSSEATREVQAEVGEVWLHLSTESVISTDDISRFNQHLLNTTRSKDMFPQFKGRDWNSIADRHLEFYGNIVGRR
jgi:beta-1,4-mannosyltransferase